METATVTKIEEGKDLIIFNTALSTFDIKESVIQDLEKSTELEITDTQSEGVVRKYRQTAKSLQVGIEKHRLKLNREFKDKTDTAAGLLEPRITAVYCNLDTKVKAVEAVKAEKKAEAARIRQEAEDKVNGFFEELNALAKAGLEYNRSSQNIAQDLGWLETFEISAVDFGERFDEAERVKSDGIATTQAAFENRLKWEEDQAEVARMKKEQEAEAKRLADERAEFEKARVAEREKQEMELSAQQAQSAVEQKRKDDAAAKLAAQEAEKNRLASEKIRLEREALEAEKEQLMADQLAADEKEYSGMWDEAHTINLGMIHTLAIHYNQGVDEVLAEQKVADEAERVAQLKKDSERQVIVAGDQNILDGYNTMILDFINQLPLPIGLQTREAKDIAKTGQARLEAFVGDLDSDIRGLA